MKRKYTVKQIIESIKFWENKLRKLVESKSVFLDKLIDKFGKDLVTGENGQYKTKVSIQMVKDIYEIANEMIFDSKLTTPSIVVNYNASNLDIMSYIYAHLPNSGKPILIRKKYVGVNGHIYSPPRIEIPWFIICTEMPFIFIVSAVVHEMIHQYDVEHGTEMLDFDNDTRSGKKHNSHGDLFKKFMDKFNEEHGLTIEEACNLSNIADEFKMAVMNVRKKLVEDSNDKSNVIYEDDFIIAKQYEDDVIVVKMS